MLSQVREAPGRGAAGSQSSPRARWRWRRRDSYRDPERRGGRGLHAGALLREAARQAAPGARPFLGRLCQQRKREREGWLSTDNGGHPVGRITHSIDMNLSKLWEMVEDGGAQRSTVHGVAKRRTGLSD